MYMIKDRQHRSRPLFSIVGSFNNYTDHAGLEIPVDLCIAAPFSRQIAIGSSSSSSTVKPLI